MAVIKCKMCGGSLDIKEGMTVATCEYCGTEQTLPRLDDDRKANLYDRANHFRRNNDFDKAMGIYESILNEDNTDSEAYWSLVLCRYGIEYVEDPATHKRVPTVNRAQFTSIFDDEDYKAAIKNADTLQRGIYEAEAKAINEIQKGILEISAKEEPFDCFISFKETDAQGRRTRDAVLAQDLYNELTKEGFKVFFAPVTLEDKLGTAYEPYIFAALNSSKVMVVLGTKPEHFNAVWVKNEWSRYLALIKGGAKKTLIPAYRDMDPYDLPEEFSHLMAQDMSKLGFMQDLIRGIKKLIGTEEPKQTVKETVAQTVVSGTSAGSQIKRGNMALEDHEWDKADSFFEEALNLDPECAEAYIGKLLAKEKKPGFASWLASQKNKYSSANTNTLYAVRNEQHHAEEKARKYSILGYLEMAEISKLYEFDTHYESELNCRNEQRTNQRKELSENVLLNRAKQYAKGETKTQLEEGLAEIEAVLNERVENARKADEANKARVESAYAAHTLRADEKAKQLRKAADEKREVDYKSASAAAAAAVDVSALKAAMKSLLALEDYKDSHELAVKCQAKIDGIREAQLNSVKKKTKKVLTIAGIAAALIAILAAVFIFFIRPSTMYKNAQEYEQNGEITKAAIAYGKAGNFKDAHEKSFALWNAAAVRDTISAGDNHTVGLKSDGTVVAVGNNDDGQCDVSKWTDIVAISAGMPASSPHTVGLKADGTVVAVGENGHGQCDVSDWTDIVAISAGRFHTVGLKSDGTVVAVGDNDDGQCNVSNWTDIVAISAVDNHTVGLKSDGTVVAVGDNDYGVCDVSEWTDIVAISAGILHTVGLKSDGTVVAVGNNGDGQCDVSEWTDIVAISAGWKYTVGLKTDGAVVAVGQNYDGQSDVSEWTDIVAISAGQYHTVGLRSNGTVVAVGDNDDGQCDVGSWKNIKLPANISTEEMAAKNAEKAEKAYAEAQKLEKDGKTAEAAIAYGKLGDYKDAHEKSFALWNDIAVRETIYASVNHTVGLKSDGTVVAVGGNDKGRCNVGEWTDVTSISAGSYYTVGLKSNGTVVAVGENDEGQCNVGEWTDITAISAGRHHTVGLKSNGTVVAVGKNDDGQCNVSKLTDIVAISAGCWHTVGLKSDGTVVAVGDNGYGKCDVSEWTDIVAISAGISHTVGLKSDGTVVAVGSNYDGMCDVSEWTDIVAISAGENYTVGLKSDGTVVAVGENNEGQCNVGEWTDIVAISAGCWHTVGLKSDGTVVAVGTNVDGQCNVSGWTDIKLPNK